MLSGEEKDFSNGYSRSFKSLTATLSLISSIFLILLGIQIFEQILLEKCRSEKLLPPPAWLTQISHCSHIHQLSSKK